MPRILPCVVTAVLMAMLLAACEKAPPKAKQKTTVTLLPDTPPPPPPPPPKELPPPPPKDAPKEVKLDQPKPEAPRQQAEQLKMDGPAGDGPSAFAAGDVKGDYTGQQLGEKGGALTGVDRMVFETYKTRLQRLLQEELVKLKELKGADYRIPARIRRDGAQWTVVLPNSTGDAKVDELLRAAVTRAIDRESPPASAPAKGFNVNVTNKLLN